MTITARRHQLRPGRARFELARDLDGTRPSVTVVIPCHDYARYLPAAVESALQQRDVDVTVVVVDDASTDDSADVARGLADQDPRVRVLVNAQNLGPVGTFNRGLEHVTAEYLVRLDADDLLTPGSLARSTAVAVHHPEVGLVYGRPRHFTGPVPQDHTSRVVGWRLWPGLRWLTNRCRDGLNVITSPEVLMRTETVHRVGGQRELAHSHDMEMWFRLSAVADVAYLVGPDQAFHREHAASLSTRQRSPLDDLTERRRAFEMLFASPPGSDLPGVEDLRHRAIEAIARSALGMAMHGDARQDVDSSTMHDLVDFARECDSGSRVDVAAFDRQRARSDQLVGRAVTMMSANARAVRGRLRGLAWRTAGTYDLR